MSTLAQLGNLLPMSALALSMAGCLVKPSLERAYAARVDAELARQPAPAPAVVLAEADLAGLPAPVRRYVLASGAVGRPVPTSVRVELDARMVKRPGAAPFAARSEQHDFFPDPTRLFAMRATMAGLPVVALHDYGGGTASMTVRVARLFDAVDVRGADLHRAETVTLLNDWVIFAPGRLADPRLRWRPIDDRSAEVALVDAGREVRATLHFDERDELVDFVSDDRLALGDDGVLRSYRFSTPLRAYKDFGGVRVASEGEAVWHYPEGPFAYGSFVTRALSYDARR
jgi:hypothetical protein